MIQFEIEIKYSLKEKRRITVRVSWAREKNR